MSHWLVSFESIFYELDVFSLEANCWHVLFGFFMHFIVVFSEGVEVVCDDWLFIDFSSWANFLEKVLEHEVFFEVIKRLGCMLEFFGWWGIIGKRGKISSLFTGSGNSAFLSEEGRVIDSTEELMRSFWGHSVRRWVVKSSDHVF